MRIFTSAFWKDAVERVGSTFFEALVAVLIVGGLSFQNLGDWVFWEPLLWITVVALVKVLAAGFISPNTGASLGTTVPGELVAAYTTQTKVVDGSYSGGRTVAHPGDTVAGPAAAVTDGRPVDVTKSEPPGVWETSPE